MVGTSENTITLTRQALYDLLWSTRISKVASSFDLSQAALLRICARFEIPIPPTGYWYKKKHGLPVRRIRLLDWTHGPEPEIAMRSQGDGHDASAPSGESRVEQLAIISFRWEDGVAKLTREQLYELLWSTPTRKLAAAFGLSDVGLAKVCKKHHIPRPPLGYWAKKEHGKHVDQIPLPTLNDEKLKEIRFHVAHQTQENRSGSGDVSRQPTIEVPDRLTSPLPIISATNDALRSATPDQHGLVTATQQETLAIRVAPQSIARCLRIANALVKAWEELGGTVDVSAKDYCGNRVIGMKFQDDMVLLSISEEIERVEVGRKDNGFRWRDWKHKPTGRLVFQIESCGWGERRRWADGSKQRLENILRRVVDGLMKHIELNRLARLDEECTKRQREQVHSVRSRRERRAKEEKERQESLLKDTANWHHAQQIRAYLKVIESGVSSGTLVTKDPSRFQEWLDWASWYADSVDPLIKAPPRLEEPEKAKNVPIDQLDLTSRTKPLVLSLGAKDTDELYRVERSRVDQAAGGYASSQWSEICRVLEGLRYDMTGRSYYDY